jgi:hypothetical protein
MGGPMRARLLSVFVLVALMLASLASSADAHRPNRRGKKNSTVRILSVTDSEIVGRVASQRNSCERSRTVDITIDGEFIDTTSTDSDGTWTMTASVEDGDVVRAHVLKTRRRNVVCNSDTDSRTADIPAGSTHTLTVSPSAGGEVNSSPGGISDCRSTSGDCSQSYTDGSTVTLTATPDGGQQFAGWGGACSGTGQCTVQMTADRLVTATFNDTGVPPEPACAVPEDVPEPLRGLLW